MERPSKERVNAALKARKAPMQSPYLDADILASEVIALREVLASMVPRCDAELAIRSYQATIARVEALPNMWESTSSAAYNHFDRAPTYIEQGMWEGFKQAAKDLRAALMGTP